MAKTMHTKFKFGKVINKRRAPQRRATGIDDLAAFPGSGNFGPLHTTH